jgi:hypothetical protein
VPEKMLKKRTAESVCSARKLAVRAASARLPSRADSLLSSIDSGARRGHCTSLWACGGRGSAARSANAAAANAGA